MIRTTIDAGVCGFRTTVTARSDDMQTVGLQILGDCQKIRGVAEALQVPIDAYKEIGDGSDGVVLSAARTHLTGCCAGCAVPSGIFKSVQVAGSVALPAPVSFTDDGVGQGPLRPADRTAPRGQRSGSRLRTGGASLANPIGRFPLFQIAFGE